MHSTIISNCESWRLTPFAIFLIALKPLLAIYPFTTHTHNLHMGLIQSPYANSSICISKCTICMMATLRRSISLKRAYVSSPPLYILFACYHCVSSRATDCRCCPRKAKLKTKTIKREKTLHFPVFLACLVLC